MERHPTHSLVVQGVT